MSNPNRTWAPSRSPLKIEYSTELLREILARRGSRDARGILFGMRSGSDVWILAAHHIAGSAPVGVFVARIRGEVFLTESDLEFLEHKQVNMALAVVGGKGGFFIRERGGSIQSIQSYQEFPVSGESACRGRTRSVGA